MARENAGDTPTKKDLVLDILVTTLTGVFALAGIISIIPYVERDLVGAIAVMAVFAVMGAAYMGAVIGEDRKWLKR